MVVTWRFFTKWPTDAAQCHRCQRFGHGSANCNLAPKCVKCGGLHHTDACNLPKKGELDNSNNARSQLKCVNCKGSHTANFRGCPARKAYLESLERRKKNSTGSQPPKLTPFKFPPNDDLAPPAGSTPSAAGRRTYAQTAGSSSREAYSRREDQVLGDGLFTITEFLSLARDMFLRLNGCNTKQQQFMALSELILTYIYSG